MTIVNISLFINWLNAQPFIRRSIGKCKITSSANVIDNINNKLSFSITNSSCIFNSSTSVGTISRSCSISISSSCCS